MFTKTIRTRTEREGDVIDITDQIKKIVKESGIDAGLVHLFV